MPELRPGLSLERVDRLRRDRDPRQAAPATHLPRAAEADTPVPGGQGGDCAGPAAAVPRLALRHLGVGSRAGHGASPVPAQAGRRAGARGLRAESLAGTLCAELDRMPELFRPFAAALRDRRKQAEVLHGDETTWMIQALAEEGDRARCWLRARLGAGMAWMQVGRPRSALAAADVFGALGVERRVVLVCDRYSSRVKLTRMHAGPFRSGPLPDLRAARLREPRQEVHASGGLDGQLAGRHRGAL